MLMVADPRSAHQVGQSGPMTGRSAGSTLSAMDAVDERLSEARDAHRRHDWRTAYRLLSELRMAAPLSTDDLHSLGEAAWWLGLIRETLAISEEVHQRYLDQGQVEKAAMVAIDNGFNWHLRGQPDIGSGWLSRGRRLLDGQPPCLGHGLLTWLDATERAAVGDVDGALAAVPRLIEMAADLEAPVLESLALALEGELRVRQGETERGFGLLDEAMLPVLAGRIPPDMAGNLYCQMMSLCDHLVDVSRARRWTATTETWCDGFAGAVMFVGICRVHRSQLLRLDGAWEDAAHAAGLAATELAELNAEAVAEAQFELGEIHRMRGDHASAAACYSAATALGRDPEPGPALSLLAQGQREEAASALRVRLAEVEDPFRRARLLRAQVEIGLALEDQVTVDTASRELADIAATYRTPGFRAWAEMATGSSRLLHGEIESALSFLRRALTCYREMGAAYDIAACRLLIAEALDAAGDSTAATTERTAALAAFTKLGAAVPLRPSAPGSLVGRVPPGGLTPREAEILVAITAGLSNRAVAAHLVISEKTVARHLANIYTKIGVSSRTAAAAWAHRNGLVPTT